MKLPTLILLAALPALAPAADLGTITFTNRTGVVITGAQVTSVTADRVIFRTEKGGGSVLLAELAADEQQRFGYDPAKAAQVATKKAEADAQLATEQARVEKERDEIRRKFEARAEWEVKENMRVQALIRAGEIENDMTPAQVQAAWGAPRSKAGGTTKSGATETWSYGLRESIRTGSANSTWSASVVFRNGRVIDWSRNSSWTTGH